jgi:hypothetical protein
MNRRTIPCEFLGSARLASLPGRRVRRRSPNRPGSGAPRPIKPFSLAYCGANPSCNLYGTVHGPDPRVLELPEVVQRALDTADVVRRRDPSRRVATQAGLVSRVLMLVPGQTGEKLRREEVFAEWSRLSAKAMGNSRPSREWPKFWLGTLASMKPWALMSQIELLEFPPAHQRGSS